MIFEVSKCFEIPQKQRYLNLTAKTDPPIIQLYVTLPHSLNLQPPNLPNNPFQIVSQKSIITNPSSIQPLIHYINKEIARNAHKRSKVFKAAPKTIGNQWVFFYSYSHSISDSFFYRSSFPIFFSFELRQFPRNYYSIRCSLNAIIDLKEYCRLQSEQKVVIANRNRRRICEMLECNLRLNSKLIR